MNPSTICQLYLSQFPNEVAPRPLMSTEIDLLVEHATRFEHFHEWFRMVCQLTMPFLGKAMTDPSLIVGFISTRKMRDSRKSSVWSKPMLAFDWKYPILVWLQMPGAQWIPLKVLPTGIKAPEDPLNIGYATVYQIIRPVSWHKELEERIYPLSLLTCAFRGRLGLDEVKEVKDDAESDGDEEDRVEFRYFRDELVNSYREAVGDEIAEQRSLCNVKYLWKVFTGPFQCDQEKFCDWFGKVLHTLKALGHSWLGNRAFPKSYMTFMTSRRCALKLLMSRSVKVGSSVVNVCQFDPRWLTVFTNLDGQRVREWWVNVVENDSNGFQVLHSQTVVPTFHELFSNEIKEQ